MRENTVEPDRPQMTIWRMRIAWWIPKVKDILRISNIYCSSPATMVARMRLSVMLYVHCLSCSPSVRLYPINLSSLVGQGWLSYNWIINVRIGQWRYFHNINISDLHHIWNFAAEATEMIVITNITKIGMGKSVVFDDFPLVSLVGCTYSLCSLLL